MPISYFTTHLPTAETGDAQDFVTCDANHITPHPPWIKAKVYAEKTSKVQWSRVVSVRLGTTGPK